MTLDACAGLVSRGDPDRFATVLAAPVPARQKLLPLYAFNLELARAPWVATEPMIAEMRLQWWRDVLGEIAQGKTRAHEVVQPLADVITSSGVPTDLLDQMAEARRWDIYGDPFEAPEDLFRYIDGTSGGLMWAAALALGASPETEQTTRDFAFAGGLAAYFRAVPELRARGRQPLPLSFDPAALAKEGLARLGSVGRVPRSVAPALWPAWQARAILSMVVKEPERVDLGTLGVAEFRRRGGLLWRAMTGRA